MFLSQDTDVAWLAGFIDGDGCFYRHKRGPRIAIYQNKRAILEEIMDMVGSGCITAFKPGPNTLRKQDGYGLYIGGRVIVESLLRLLLPYLKVKRALAEELLYELKGNGMARSACPSLDTEEVQHEEDADTGADEA